MTFPTPMRDPRQDVVRSGAMRLTWISGGLAGLATLVTAFNNNIIKIFGDRLDDGIKASVLITIIAAWALIAVADLFSRAIVTSARLRRPPTDAIAAPNGLRVTLTDGTDSVGWTVAAVRKAEAKAAGADGGAEAGGLEFLVMKVGNPPKWVDQSGVALEA